MRVAIITGTSRGLGEAMAEAFHAEGWHILCLARSHTAQQGARATSGKATLGGLSLDTLDEASAKQCVALIPEQATELVYVANAAVVWPISRVGDADRTAISTAIATNVTGSILIAEAVVSVARQKSLPLTILNISSGAARRALPGWSIYCASKAAIDMYFDALALDHPTIVVKRIDPGVMDTGMQADIRASGPDAFALHADFQRLKDDGTLRPAARVAREILADAFPHAVQPQG